MFLVEILSNLSTTAAASLHISPKANHLELEQGRISSFGVHLLLGGLVGLVAHETHDTILVVKLSEALHKTRVLD